MGEDGEPKTVPAYGRLFVIKRNGTTGHSMPLRRDRYTLGLDNGNDVELRLPGAAPLHASLTRVGPDSCDVLLKCESVDAPVELGDGRALTHSSEAVRLTAGDEFVIAARRFRFDRADAPHRQYPPEPLPDFPQESLRTHGKLRVREPTTTASPKTPKKTRRERETPQSPAGQAGSRSPNKCMHTRVLAPEGCLLLFQRGAQGTDRVTCHEVGELCKAYHVGYAAIRGLTEHPGSEWHGWRFAGVIDANTEELAPGKELVFIEP